jgi:hypothetical protein
MWLLSGGGAYLLFCRLRSFFAISCRRRNCILLLFFSNKISQGALCRIPGILMLFRDDVNQEIVSGVSQFFLFTLRDRFQFFNLLMAVLENHLLFLEGRE